MSNQKSWEKSIISIFGTDAQFGSDIAFISQNDLDWIAVVSSRHDLHLGRFENNTGYIYATAHWI